MEIMVEKNQEIDLSFSEGMERCIQKREERYSANAHVKMLENQLLLTNISLNGGRIQGDEFVGVIPSGKYTISVIPEEESNIDKFEVDILSKWVKIRRSGTESGFIMVLPPGSRIVEGYIEYLKKKIMLKNSRTST
jgi:hypothetical protein